MTKDAFRQFLLAQIDRLDARYQLCERAGPEHDGAAYADAAARAGDMAARLGLADLYERSRTFGQYAGWPDAKGFLALCLAAVQPTPEPVLIGESIGVEELATMLGVNVRTIYRRRNDGTLPAPIQVGRLVRWRRADVEAFMASN